jgi:hypothetical protein
MKLLLCAFERVSRLKSTNFHKNELFCLRCPKYFDQYVELFGCKSGDFLIHYLRISIHSKKLRNIEFWLPIILVESQPNRPWDRMRPITHPTCGTRASAYIESKLSQPVVVWIVAITLPMDEGPRSMGCSSCRQLRPSHPCRLQMTGTRTLPSGVCGVWWWHKVSGHSTAAARTNVSCTRAFRPFFTSEVWWDIGNDVCKLIKKLITWLAWKPRDEFIKPN